MEKKLGVLYRVLTVIAAGLVIWAFYSPIWWVTLKAPNYPPEAYPQGVRIHFHANKIANGCTELPSDEIYAENEELDCVEEMNVINHFIGMEPMERGGQLEMAFAPYGFAGTVVLLLLFLFYKGWGWWILPIPGIIIPVAFVVDYAGWLWWFGHNLHDWGAFTVKPFMPTVFGESKVAQFSTFSYPHYGFGLLAGASILLLLALLMRRKQLKLERAASGEAAE